MKTVPRRSVAVNQMTVSRCLPSRAAPTPRTTVRLLVRRTIVFKRPTAMSWTEPGAGQTVEFILMNRKLPIIARRL